MQLYKIFIMIVKNYYHYYRYLTYLSLLFITYLQENVDVNFNVNERFEVCLCEVNKTSQVLECGTMTSFDRKENCEDMTNKL